MELKLNLLDSSVVIIADTHNPSILHPSFLTANKIVPESWKQVDPLMTTPAFSVVNYDNGTSFTAEPTKFQVLSHSEEGRATIASMASSYLGVLPHVRYTAVGINLTAAIGMDDPPSWIRERFIKPGPWTERHEELVATAFKLTYKVDGALLTVSCEPGKVPLTDGVRSATIVVANYHMRLKKQGYEGANEALQTYPDRVKHFYDIAASTFGAT
ncbi:hypothetical protein [Roseimicrobium sp. ORNL1]|uniref:hypothetical protein n=1 Tax=Roseimicrobium sp. ORNL1 TaxID=2711231 RepID=UPI0013E15910|nr:hypothetical protein [Roseimicrobium sp. ORNL1]QIF04645.1 hypothetical protein G5S37_24985 [Roseimicrobium sp. ORNL1]